MQKSVPSLKNTKSLKYNVGLVGQLPPEDFDSTVATCLDLQSLRSWLSPSQRQHLEDVAEVPSPEDISPQELYPAPFLEDRPITRIKSRVSGPGQCCTY